MNSGRRLAWAVGLALCLGHVAMAQDTDAQELVRRGKAATALLLKEQAGQPRSSATAFCVSRSGLFITSKQVVDSFARADVVELVLCANEAGERKVSAEVLRTDPDADLALLKATGDKGGPFEALTVSEVDDLYETMDVWAFSFPFGRGIVADKARQPNITVSVRKIISLRKQGGMLDRIQLDASLSPGNSGGPVVNAKGEVIGMVVSAVHASGGNLAVPARLLRGFLETPVVDLQPTRIDKGALGRPVEFIARVTSFETPIPQYVVQLALEHMGRTQTVRLAPKGQGYCGSATIGDSSLLRRIRVEATYPLGHLSGYCQDANLVLEGEKVPFVRIREITTQPEPQVRLEDGRVLAVSSKDLSPINVYLGGQQVQVDLARATNVRLAPQEIELWVPYVLEVRKGDRTVRKDAGTIYIDSISQGTGGTGLGRLEGGAEALPIRPATVAGLKELKLPDLARDLICGGGGRFLVMHFARLQKLGVFDVNEGRIVHFLPAGTSKPLFACGRTKLLVVLPDQRIIQRWDLRTGQKELTAMLPFESVKSLAMGCDTDARALASVERRLPSPKAEFAFLDVTTLQATNVPISGQPAFLGGGQVTSLRASADGLVYGLWLSGVSPSSIGVVSITDSGATYKQTHASGGHVVPGPDGSIIYTSATLYTRELMPLACSPTGVGSGFIPAVHGNYFLGEVIDPSSLDRYSRSSTTRDKFYLALFIVGHNTPLLQLDPIPVPELKSPAYEGRYLPTTPDKRYFLIPAAELLIVFPPAADRLLLKHINIQEALDKSGVDYLFVASSPTSTAIAGAVYRYQVVVKSKRGGVRYKLQSGPPGMWISPDGLITWNVPSGETNQHVSAVLLVADTSGQEVYHSFTLTVR